MSHPTLSEEVTRMVRRLSELQGSCDVSVFARRFTRSGPAETITSYEERRRSFPAGNVPESIGLPAHPDEIVIDVKGRIAGPDLLGELIHQVRATSRAAQTGMHWDVRSSVEHDEAGGGETYRFTLFTEAGAGGAGNGSGHGAEWL